MINVDHKYLFVEKNKIKKIINKKMVASVKCKENSLLTGYDADI